MSTMSRSIHSICREFLLALCFFYRVQIFGIQEALPYLETEPLVIRWTWFELGGGNSDACACARRFINGDNYSASGNLYCSQKVLGW